MNVCLYLVADSVRLSIKAVMKNSLVKVFLRHVRQWGSCDLGVTATYFEEFMMIQILFSKSYL